MYIVDKSKVKKITSIVTRSGWEVWLKEGVFFAQVVILFESEVSIAEAKWYGDHDQDIPTYVRVEADHA